MTAVELPRLESTRRCFENINKNHEFGRIVCLASVISSAGWVVSDSLSERRRVDLLDGACFAFAALFSIILYRTLFAPVTYDQFKRALHQLLTVETCKDVSRLDFPLGWYLREGIISGWHYNKLEECLKAHRGEGSIHVCNMKLEATKEERLDDLPNSTVGSFLLGHIRRDQMPTHDQYISMD